MTLAQIDIETLSLVLPKSFLDLSPIEVKGEPARQLFVSYLARLVLREESERKQPLYHNLQSKEMERIFGESAKKRVVAPLEEAGIVEVNPRYAVGRFSKGYRLATVCRLELLKGDFEIVQLTDKAQLGRFERWQERNHQAALERFPNLQHQLDMADAFYVDIDGLEDHLERLELGGVWRGTELTKGRHQYLRAQAQSMVAFFEGSNRRAHYASGRIHTPLCNVPRDIRKFILPKNGEALVEIDLKSAQLVFLCVAIRSIMRRGARYGGESFHQDVIDDKFNLLERDGTTPADIYAFMSSVLFDDIYTMLHEDMLQGEYVISSRKQRRLPKQERDAMKKKAFRDILFSPSPMHPRDAKGLRNLVWKEYPSVMEFIHQFNELSTRTKRSSELAVMLQELEGDFFNRHLMDLFSWAEVEMGVFLVYDALFVPESYTNSVLGWCVSTSKVRYAVDFRFSAELV